MLVAYYRTTDDTLHALRVTPMNLDHVHDIIMDRGAKDPDYEACGLTEIPSVVIQAMTKRGALLWIKE